MAVKRYNGTSWDTVAGLGAQGAAATSSSITTWVKTASGGETSLTGSSDSSTTLAYTPGQEQVFINGVLQVRGSDYTATNGTSITGLTALIAGDIATVTTVNAFSVTGAVPLSTVTANGDLIVGTSSGAVGRLGVGSTGQVLSVSGGVPTWATPATPTSGLTYLTGTSFSGVSSVSLPTNTFTSTYVNYVMYLTITAASANHDMGYRGRTAGTDFSSSSYHYAQLGYKINSSYFNTAGLSADRMYLHGGTATSDLVAGEVKIFSPQTTNNTRLYFNGMGSESGTANVQSGVGLLQSSNQFDSLTFFPSTGTISGFYRVYGIANS